MAHMERPPIAVPLSCDIEHRPDRRLSYRARVRWVDPHIKERLSASEACATEESARDLIDALTAAALRGIDPATYTQPLVPKKTP